MQDQRFDGKDLSSAAQAYIEAHSAERFSLQEMADALFVNACHLLRVFKRRTGMTPLSYHHLIRCRKAKELLVQTDRTVSEIGEAVGFVSSSHFSHIFRKTEGCTPSEYRSLNQPADPEEASPARRLPPGAAQHPSQ